MTQFPDSSQATPNPLLPPPPSPNAAGYQPPIYATDASSSLYQPASPPQPPPLPQPAYPGAPSPSLYQAAPTPGAHAGSIAQPYPQEPVPPQPHVSQQPAFSQQPVVSQQFVYADPAPISVIGHMTGPIPPLPVPAQPAPVAYRAPAPPLSQRLEAGFADAPRWTGRLRWVGLGGAVLGVLGGLAGMILVISQNTWWNVHGSTKAWLAGAVLVGSVFTGLLTLAVAAVVANIGDDLRSPRARHEERG